MLTREYLILSAVGLAAILFFGAYLAGYLPFVYSAPKVHLSANITKAIYYPSANVLYVDTYISSSSNVEVCIDAVAVKDLNTGYTIVVPPNTSSQSSNLPVCIEPGSTFHLGISYVAEGGASLNAGDTVMVEFYYSVGGPSYTVDAYSLKYFVSYATLATGAPTP